MWEGLLDTIIPKKNFPKKTIQRITGASGKTSEKRINQFFFVVMTSEVVKTASRLFVPIPSREVKLLQLLNCLKAYVHCTIYRAIQIKINQISKKKKRKIR